MKAEQKEILSRYVKLAKAKGRHPSIAELEKSGLTRNKARHYFGTLEDLRKAAKEHDPKTFENMDDEELFSAKNFRRLEAETAKHQRFVITTAVSGCEVHEGFLASIRNYCKVNNARLLILPASDPASTAQAEANARRWYYVGKKIFLDPALRDDLIVFGDLSLNRKFFVSCVKLSAKHIDPSTSFGRVGQRNGSFVYASPKQRLKMTPTSNKKLPHAVMTTGAITRPNYESNRYMSGRTAYLADHDHIMGAIIVEIRNEKRYHFRQIQANRSGHFADLGKMYTPSEVKPYAPELIVHGDFHSGATDPVSRASFIDNADSVTAITGVRRAVIHDGFDGLSINHHEIKNKVLRAQRAIECKVSLLAELTGYAKDLDALTDRYDEVVVSLSNHDEFLIRYLSDGLFMNEPHNSLLGSKLFTAAIEGHNPVRFAVEQIVGLKHPEKIRWLDRDEDFKIAGIECGAHGDKGANGARGSLRAMENAYGNSVSGHAHTPEILRGAWQVGTLSKLKLNYNVGPSSWMPTSCLVYPNGMRQMINVIDGRWRLDDDEKMQQVQADEAV